MISITVTVMKIKDIVIANWMLFTRIVSSTTPYKALSKARIFRIKTNPRSLIPTALW